MNELAVLDGVETAILAIKDEESVKEFIMKMDALELLLKSIDTFNENARKFAKMEALAFLRIVELGLAGEIPAKGDKRNTALWLADLTPEERNEVVRICGDEGVTIHYYWKKVVHENEMVEYAIQHYRSQAGWAVREFKEKGVVKLNKYLEPGRLGMKQSLLNRVPPDLQEGIKDQVRHRIRELGGHGLGDGEGTYMTASEAYYNLDEILENKVKSILKDVHRMRKIVREADDFEEPDRDFFDPERFSIERESNFTDDMSDESCVGVMLCLLGICKPDWRTSTYAGKYNMVIYMLGKLGIDEEWLYTMMGKSIKRRLELEGSGKECADILAHAGRKEKVEVVA